MDLGLIIAIFLAVALVMLLRSVVHIVPQYQRLVVLTFGQYNQASGIAGPGLVLLFPPPIWFFVERGDNFKTFLLKTAVGKQRQAEVADAD